jgi:hypothetical protein
MSIVVNRTSAIGLARLCTMQSFLARCHFAFALAIAVAIGLLNSAACDAFPLDPARIFARDVSPSAGKFEVEASVWQGGDASTLDAGTRIYLEKRTVETDSEGRYDFWLGESKPIEGTLSGDKYGLDQTLYLQLRYLPSGAQEYVTRRFGLSPIDDSYIAANTSPPAVKKPGPEDLAKFYKTYEPTIEKFSPELVRRGLATLYPDGRLQTENGTFLETTGTTTSGVQEFFDYCTEHPVDGYIVGGSIPHGQQIVYQIWSPLKLHPAQGIRIDTGAISLQFMPILGDEPGLTIDSCMMNDIRIRGLLLYLGKGYALSVKPSNPLPLDRFVGNTIVDTIVYVTSIACRGKGAVDFDGSINFSRFEFNEINHGAVGINVSKSSSFSNNRITCKHIHGQIDASIVDESGIHNTWEVNLNCDAKDPLGIVTNGRDSVWFCNVNTRSKPGVTLLPDARGNQFFLTGLSGGYDNQANEPTNRFFASPSIPADKIRLGFAVETPPTPESGELVINRNPFPVLVMFKSPGSISRWELNDTYGASDEFVGPLQSGQSIYLSPGEAIRLHYSTIPPEWRWRAVQ